MSTATALPMTSSTPPIPGLATARSQTCVPRAIIAATHFGEDPVLGLRCIRPGRSRSMGPWCSLQHSLSSKKAPMSTLSRQSHADEQDKANKGFIFRYCHGVRLFCWQVTSVEAEPLCVLNPSELSYSADQLGPLTMANHGLSPRIDWARMHRCGSRGRLCRHNPIGIFSLKQSRTGVRSFERRLGACEESRANGYSWKRVVISKLDGNAWMSDEEE